MKEKNWYQTYPEHPGATNLSMIGGALRLLAILLGAVMGILTVIFLIVCIYAVWQTGSGRVIFHLIDEMDDELLGGIFLWCAVAVNAYISSALRCKARLLAGEK